jgi:hypothetical protein
MDSAIDNFLKKRPVRVVWMDAPPRTSRGDDGSADPADRVQAVPAHTFCFVGSDGIPKYVREDLARVAAALKLGAASPQGAAGASRQVSEACNTRNLREYFEAESNMTVADILGVNLAASTAKIASECRANARERNPEGVRGGANAQARDDALDDDAELATIERMLEDEKSADTSAKRSVSSSIAQIERPPKFAADGLTIVPDMQMFPEDSVTDMKRKIFVQTRIPIYRQHLVAVHARRGNDAGTIAISYSLSTTGQHMIEFRDLYCALRGNDVALFGIPIDRAIYDARDDIRVEARDHITTLDMLRADFFIVLDIANWIVPNIENIRAALKDNYQFEMLYYGFIVKYFPQLTRECFHSYITNEGEMADRFPDLAPAWTTVRNSALIQCRLSSAIYASMARGRERTDLDHIIMHATVHSRTPGVPLRPINLRDLFDSIVCSKTIVDVRALIDSGTQRDKRDALRYEVRKFHRYSELVSAASGAGAGAGASLRIPPLGGEAGLVVTFVLDDIPMFMMVRPGGRVSFIFQWREEDEIAFAEMAAMFRKYTARLLAEMRGTGVFIASQVNAVTETNMRVQSLTVAVRWKRTISAKHFRLLREAWGEYIHAGIAIPRQTTKDVFSFIFTRGIMDVDMMQLEQRLAAANIIEANHYAYLSVSAMRQKWTQNFAGRVVSVTHRATDVRFDVQDIYDREYTIFEMYLSGFIANFVKSNETTLSSVELSERDTAPEHRKLRRLQEIDPVLYNLKKHGAPRVYSTRCQRGKQPMLYSEAEARAGVVPKNAVKYWNFTLQKPAHYACPDAKYPHLGFIVDVHPKGYCIPCCGKIKPTPGSKHAQVEKICMGEHSFKVKSLIEQPVGYIMSYGKDLPENRLSHLPSGYLRDTLNRAVNASSAGALLLIYGVPQNIGIIHTVRAILGLSLKDFIEGIVRGIEKGLIGFDAIAGGRAATYFTSKQAFTGYIAGIAHGREYFPEGTVEFMRAVITDCARIVYDLEMIFLVAAEQSQDMRIIMPSRSRRESLRDTSDALDDEFRDKVGFAVIDEDESINPVLAIHPDDFARDGSIVSRTLIPECDAIMRQIARGYDMHRMKVPDLALIREFCAGASASAPAQYKVRKLYVGLRGLCYAVMLANGTSDGTSDVPSGALAYVPIAYSGNVQKRADEDVALDSLDDSATLAATKGAIDAINAFISHKKLPFHQMVIDELAKVGDDVIGVMVRAGMRMIAYCATSQQDSTGKARLLSMDPRKHARVLLATRGTVTYADNPVISRINDEAAKQMYPYYEYELFCAQFMAKVATLRNEPTRAHIKEIFDGSGAIANKRASLRDLGLSKSDLAIVINMLGTKKWREVLVRVNLDADMGDLYTIIEEGNEEKLAAWIASMMAEITQHATGQRVPDVIAPCMTSSYGGSKEPAKDFGSSDAPAQSTHHCSPDGKLLLRSSLETLSAILAADLCNSLKRAYIFARGSTPESRSAFADFTQRAGEILLIKRHEILS